MISVMGYAFSIDRPPSPFLLLEDKLGYSVVDSEPEVLNSEPGICDFRQGFLVSLSPNFLIFKMGRILSTS